MTTKKTVFLIGTLLLILLVTGLLARDRLRLRNAPWGEAARFHTARQLSAYPKYREVPLEERVYVATPEIVDYIRRDNKAHGWPEVPHPAQPSSEILEDVRQALAEMPESVNTKVAEKLVGLYLIENLGGSAYTEIVLDEKGRPLHAFTAVDIRAVDRRANDWATWKENSPFRADLSRPITLKAIIEEPAQNNRKNAMQYILLHEFGHVLAAGTPEVAIWGKKPNPVEWAKARFTRLSWHLVDGKPSLKSESTLLAKIQYYVAPTWRLPLGNALVAYEDLAKTDFPTLYAVTNPADDFAESFASYVHAVIMKRPWGIQISIGADIVQKFSLCWSEPRCQEKRRVLEEILQR